MDSKAKGSMRGVLARVAASIVVVLGLGLAFWGTVALIRFAHGGENALPLSDNAKLIGAALLCLLIAMRWWMPRRR